MSDAYFQDPILQGFMELPGLAGVKDMFRQLALRLQLMPEPPQPGAYAFVGNPGSGKTYAATVLARLLHNAGVLPKGHVVAPSDSQLLASPSAFSDALESAKGGMLVIDNPYRLTESPKGLPVLQALVVALNDPAVKKNTCIVLTGYPEEIAAFLKTDASLPNRLQAVHFPDYTPEELLLLLEDMARNADRHPRLNTPCPLKLTPEFLEMSLSLFQAVSQNSANFGNAAFVAAFLQDCYSNLCHRLCSAEVSDTQQWVLLPEDMPTKYRNILSA